MHGPGCQELPERHLAELGVEPSPLEVSLVPEELSQPTQALGPELAEGLDQRRQRNPSIALHVGDPVEGIEPAAGSVADDPLGSRYPIAELGRDQVADDVAGGPATWR